MPFSADLAKGLDLGNGNAVLLSGAAPTVGEVLVADGPNAATFAAVPGGLPGGSQGQSLVFGVAGAIFVTSLVDARAYGVAADNSTDDTAAIQAACNAAAYPIAGLSGNDVPARVVQLPPGRMRTSSVINLPPNCTLRGHGPSGSYLVTSQTSGSVVQNATNAAQVEICELGIIYAGTATAGSAISLTTPGATILGDSRNMVRNVQIIGPYTGVTSSGTTELRLHQVTVQRAILSGFDLHLATDSFISDCTIGAPGKWGISLGANSRMWGTIVFGGGDGTSNAIGIEGGGRSEVACCQVQDFNGGGFGIDNPVVMSACLTDSVAGTGFIISSAGSSGASILAACRAVVRVGGAYTTPLALDCRGTNFMQIDLSADGCTTIASFSQSSAQAGNYYNINNARGLQTIAYAAAVTPDAYAGGTVLLGTVAGNLTINVPTGSGSITNPTHWYPDQELTFILPVDATGGYTLTFGSKYVLNGAAPALTANTRPRITFHYDIHAAVWRESGRIVY